MRTAQSLVTHYDVRGLSSELPYPNPRRPPPPLRRALLLRPELKLLDELREDINRFVGKTLELGRVPDPSELKGGCGTGCGCGHNH